ncbi:MAG: ribonuclease VapC [Solirubrobacteraceae bacterium]|jgi:hypothetical protein|nr:ribonuclease VapC [Solirubrobacteraceae bacterium]
MTQGDTPDWRPLEQTVGMELTGDFMWMFEVTLADGRRLQAYKHICTRRYVHLDADGAAFVYESRERYRSRPAADVLAGVFATLPGLYGVTDEQVARSWAAVDRLEETADPSRP